MAPEIGKKITCVSNIKWNCLKVTQLFIALLTEDEFLQFLWHPLTDINLPIYIAFIIT